MLNIACGAKMDWRWNNIDFSLYARLARHPSVARVLLKMGMLSAARHRTLASVDPEIVNWDLRHGIPFRANTFDVVYHSHFLEHIDRDAAPLLLKECYRVLKPSGHIRVVVPDLYCAATRYVSSVVQLEAGNRSVLHDHREAINRLFEQMVRRRPVGTRLQSRWVRLIERFVRRDATVVGEVHRWMYDRYSLQEILMEVGFIEVSAETPFSSRIRGWGEFGLDVKEDGTVYKPDSIYMEGTKGMSTPSASARDVLRVAPVGAVTRVSS